jgi:hypothetical protein
VNETKTAATTNEPKVLQENGLGMHGPMALCEIPGCLGGQGIYKCYYEGFLGGNEGCNRQMCENHQTIRLEKRPKPGSVRHGHGHGRKTHTQWEDIKIAICNDCLPK